MHVLHARKHFDALTNSLQSYHCTARRALVLTLANSHIFREISLALHLVSISALRCHFGWSWSLVTFFRIRCIRKMISEEEKKSLAESSVKAKENAYCPYSKFRVGAAVLVQFKNTGERRIFTG